MHLKLGVVFSKKPAMTELESVVLDILYPYLSSSPIKEIILKDGYNKSEMEEKYKEYREEYYRSVSFKDKKEDMISRGIDTLEGFCREVYGISRFTEDDCSVVTHNSKAFIDEYKVKELKKVKEIEGDYLSMNLNALIDKDFKVHHRETQMYKRTPSEVIKPVEDNLKKTDYIALIDYTF